MLLSVSLLFIRSQRKSQRMKRWQRQINETFTHTRFSLSKHAWIQCEEPQTKERQRKKPPPIRRLCVCLQISINEEANCSIRIYSDVSNRDRERERTKGDRGNWPSSAQSRKKDEDKQPKQHQQQLKQQYNTSTLRHTKTKHNTHTHTFMQAFQALATQNKDCAHWYIHTHTLQQTCKLVYFPFDGDRNRWGRWRRKRMANDFQSNRWDGMSEMKKFKLFILTPSNVRYSVAFVVFLFFFFLFCRSESVQIFQSYYGCSFVLFFFASSLMFFSSSLLFLHHRSIQ